MYHLLVGILGMFICLLSGGYGFKVPGFHGASPRVGRSVYHVVVIT